MSKLFVILFSLSLFLYLPSHAQTASDASSVREEVIEGKAEVVGEPNVLANAARESWKKACENWKKEVKELNKEVLILNCNSPKCTTEKGRTTCKSDASYKIKVKLRN